jgi:DNA (cytosine-5)-methyltransferase 1
MTKFQEWPDANVDVLVGGTPCQSFSVAGLRKGLDDPRGNLMLTYGAIAKRYRPKWVVFENVPGLLSSNGGRDFGTLLGMLGELGYGFAYRVLDAQFVRTRQHPRAVPQRRRRVFVVGCLGDWRSAAAVFFDRESLSGFAEPKRKKWETDAKEFTPDIVWRGGDQANSEMMENCAGTLTCNEGQRGGLIFNNQQFGGYAKGEIASTLNQRDYKSASDLVVGTYSVPAIGNIKSDDVSSTITRNTGGGGETQNPAYAAIGNRVRRLTPTECERLQGFPDGYTNIPWRGKPEAPDGSRYKALGNSMAVPCMRWIGERIQQVEAL